MDSFGLLSYVLFSNTPRMLAETIPNKWNASRIDSFLSVRFTNGFRIAGAYIDICTNGKNSGRMSNDARNLKGQHAPKEGSSQEGKEEMEGGNNTEPTFTSNALSMSRTSSLECFHNPFRTDIFFLDYNSLPERDICRIRELHENYYEHAQRNC